MPAPPLPETRLRGFATRGLRFLLIGSAISLAFSALFARRFVSGFVYGLTITMMCWFFIDGGRLLVARWIHRNDPPDDDASASRWPGWPWMLVVIVLGTFAGTTLGNMLGNWITGENNAGVLNSNLRQGVAIMLFSLIPGLAFTYVFYSRAVIAKTEAKAQLAQRQAAENQLKLLESQLEPHMLFNTLANLRVLIGLDPPRAQLMLDRLIAFLRATLNASRAAMHPLAAEFARVADYVALMQIRMGDRLQPQLDLPDELAALTVPPLLLQPLVENAIKHGLEPHVRGGRLIVSAARDGNRLLLRVRDTGVGPSTVPQPASGDTAGFGLQQIRDRLATLYGGAAGVALEAADDGAGGALATVHLPIESP